MDFSYFIVILAVTAQLCQARVFNHEDADTREFPDMQLSPEDIAVLKMLKNDKILGALLDGDANTTDVRAFGWKIFPGTHWCGNGHIANSDSDEDLGSFKNLDRCCRTHDKCPRNLKSQALGYGTKNTGKYTASDCACDDEFKSCLKAVPKGKWYHIKTRLEHGSSQLVGKLFFNLLKMKCLKFDEKPQPITNDADDISDAEEEKAKLVAPNPF
ncbi:acidic phospholipase A2 PA4-like [Hydractinia symbiolongicarpus]|uniref:acidic phospholipase A2 PA4-like n=1 Tax=Hydractinia symbiolongicarpus TaxID=13093 RepID=UPI00254CD4E9|nr:acidic phospholipase A2 PA4-like [Hydractinia symbiolongicarpus]